MKKVAVVALSAGMVGLPAAPAHPADQTILGKSFSVKAKPGDARKTNVDGSASEKRSDNTVVGDPTAAGSAGGAILTVFASGGTPTMQTFVLDQGMTGKGKPFWSGSADKGFSYQDPKGEQGAVTSVSIKKSPSGMFSIKASIAGRTDRSRSCRRIPVPTRASRCSSVSTGRRVTDTTCSSDPGASSRTMTGSSSKR